MNALNERLIAMNIASAYYFMGYYVEHGIGVERDFMNALRFYRKAADLGNAEAQYFIGHFFVSQIWRNQENKGYQPEIGNKILTCAGQSRGP